MRRKFGALATAMLTITFTAALTGLTAPAHASTSKVTDGNDASTPLDLASAKLETAAKGTKIVATVAMHDAFTDEQLAAPSTIGIDFRINGSTVRGVAARVVSGVLKADVCTYKDGGSVLGSKCASVKVKRLDDRTIQLVVKRAKVSSAKVLKWRAGAAYFAGGCLDPLECLDTAPGGPSAFKTWKV